MFIRLRLQTRRQRQRGGPRRGRSSQNRKRRVRVGQQRGYDSHQEYTGVSSKIIKEHIAYVLKSEHKHKVIIRTPLIPTMTATDENITAICQFLVDIAPEVQYELLNYNPLASAKYDLVEFEYGVDKQYKMFNQQQMQHFYDIVKAAGLKNLIIE